MSLSFNEIDDITIIFPNEEGENYSDCRYYPDSPFCSDENWDNSEAPVPFENWGKSGCAVGFKIDPDGEEFIGIRAQCHPELPRGPMPAWEPPPILSCDRSPPDPYSAKGIKQWMQKCFPFTDRFLFARYARRLTFTKPAEAVSSAINGFTLRVLLSEQGEIILDILPTWYVPTVIPISPEEFDETIKISKLQTAPGFAGYSTPGDMEWLLYNWNDIPVEPEPSRPPIYPPPPPRRRCECMGCCAGNDNKNQDLSEVKRLLRIVANRIGKPTKVNIFDINQNQQGAQRKEVRFGSLFDAMRIAVWRTEIANAHIGIDSFPMEVPETSILPERWGPWKQIFEFIKPQARRRIDSLAELQQWLAEQDAARAGQWHQSIKVELEDGKESRIVLTDQASTLKEIFLLTHELAKSNVLLTDIATKALTEASAARAEAAKAWLVSRDVQEWLDYTTQEVSHDVPLGISPFKYSRSGPDVPEVVELQDDLEMLLQPGTAKVKTDEWDGRNSLSDFLIEAKQILSNLRAITWQQIKK